jgi:nucleoid-associated protein YgaU
MTADAKIGLLLALVFIVGITFVINGLPDFLNKTKDQPDTIGYINHYKQQAPALVGQSRNIAATLNKPVVVVTQPSAAEANSQPQTTQVAVETVMPAAQEAVNTAAISSQPEQAPVVVEEKPKAVKQLAVYEVRSGDSLAEIALKFYGQKEGKKLASIERIFNVNKDKLSSIESIQVGQKLIIPAVESKTEELVKTGIFENVKSAPSKDSKQIAKEAAKKTETPKDVKAQKTQKEQKEQKQPKEQFKIYTIKESDSLWQIALKQLGDGNRYKEIIKLNKNVLNDGNSLVVGTKIKLPAK